MTESAYLVGGFSPLIARGLRPLPTYQGRSGIRISRNQAQVHYTPNLAQEINLSRIQRQLIADKGSSDNGQSRDMCAAYKRVSQCCQPGESPGTLVRTALPERCLLSLDRNLKDNQGGCLYEWPCSQKYASSQAWAENPQVAILVSGVKSRECRFDSCGVVWQKPGIGPMAVRKSSNVQSKPGTDDPCQLGGWRSNANHTCMPGGALNHPVEGIVSEINWRM